MALGAIGTLGAIGSGIAKAMPSIIEEREKELNANFVTEFHRISTSGTEEEMTQLLEDPRYSNVSPQVRQRVMETAARVADKRATQAFRERQFGQRAEERERAHREDVVKQRALGWNVETGYPDYLPTEEGERRLAGLLEQDPEGEGFQQFTREVAKLDPGEPEITGLTRGADLQERYDLETATMRETLEGKRADTDLKNARLEEQNRVQETIDRVFRSVLRSGNQDLSNYLPEVRQQVQVMMNEVGLSSARERGMPMAFVKQRSEMVSAVGELNRLMKTLDHNRDMTGPIDAFLSYIFAPARRATIVSHINLVKQRVAKSLEGGVLRKEDEEKYKKILATIWDFDSTSIAKMQNLVYTLTQDMENLEDAWEDVKMQGGVGVNPDSEILMSIAIRDGLIQADRFPFREIRY